MFNKLRLPRKINGIAFILVSLILLTSISCTKDGCELPDCTVRIRNGSTITITGNVSGGEGTQITADSIDSSSITSNAAVIKFTVLKIGGCHKVMGYGHTWSSTSATPRIGTDNFVDYEDNINFNDEVSTIMRNLFPKTKYWVRSWIAIEKKDCTQERVIFYNDFISEFRTL